MRRKAVATSVVKRFGSCEQKRCIKSKTRIRWNRRDPAFVLCGIWPLKESSIEDAHLAGHCDEGIERLVDLFAGMFAGHNGTDARFALRDSRKCDTRRHDS